MKLSKRCSIITGGSAGLGFAVAKAFVVEGASVAICGRQGRELASAAAELRAMARPQQKIVAVRCDVSEEAGVAELIDQSLAEFKTIQILVNNAGVLGPTGRLEDVDLGCWRQAFDVNFYGTLIPCRAVLPYLRSAEYGKIINLSGGGATSPRPFFGAYATSKAAVVRLTENLAAELQGTGIDVNAVAPGALNTRMLEQTIDAGPGRIGSSQYSQVLRQRESGGASLEKATELFVYLASSASDGITGRLLSAPWDPWSTLHTRVEELQGTDIYTLRRIVPEDRAKKWG